MHAAGHQSFYCHSSLSPYGQMHASGGPGQGDCRKEKTRTAGRFAKYVLTSSVNFPSSSGVQAPAFRASPSLRVLNLSRTASGSRPNDAPISTHLSPFAACSSFSFSTSFAVHLPCGETNTSIDSVANISVKVGITIQERCRSLRSAISLTALHPRLTACPQLIPNMARNLTYTSDSNEESWQMQLLWSGLLFCSASSQGKGPAAQAAAHKSKRILLDTQHGPANPHSTAR